MVGALDVSSSVAAFEKMEEKVLAMEAEAEAAGVVRMGMQCGERLTGLDFSC